MNIVFLGPPGSGKGTQAVKLAKKLGVAHLSTGDVLRDAVKKGTSLGKLAEKHMSAGELVPDELIIGIIEEKIDSGELSGGFILDGFPRTIPQAESLSEMFKEHALDLDKVILFQVSDEEIFRRLEGRARIEGRADDTRDVIANRLEVYRTQTQPIEEFYRKSSKLVEVKGEGTPDEVFDSLVAVTA